MDVLGWSDSKIANRYMHVPDELKHEIAGQVAGLLWSTPPAEIAADERVELTGDQRAAVRLMASALPPYWQRRMVAPLDDNGDGRAPVPVPAQLRRSRP
jgi:hypothetical protein